MQNARACYEKCRITRGALTPLLCSRKIFNYRKSNSSRGICRREFPSEISTNFGKEFRGDGNYDNLREASPLILIPIIYIKGYYVTMHLRYIA